MKTPEALTKMRRMLRSKTQGNWIDAHLLDYLADAQDEAYQLEIIADPERFVTSADIVGTGAELYTLPDKFNQPILVRSKTGKNIYTQVSYHNRLRLENTEPMSISQVLNTYYLRDGQIGFPSQTTDTIEVIYHYNHTPMSTSNDSDLSLWAVKYAIVLAVIDALRDRGDVNTASFERKREEYRRELFRQKRAERNNGPTILSSPHLWDNFSYRGVF